MDLHRRKKIIYLLSQMDDNELEPSFDLVEQHLLVPARSQNVQRMLWLGIAIQLVSGVMALMLVINPSMARLLVVAAQSSAVLGLVASIVSFCRGKKIISKKDFPKLLVGCLGWSVVIASPGINGVDNVVVAAAVLVGLSQVTLLYFAGGIYLVLESLRARYHLVTT